jgi:hypothetical protein
VLFSNLDAAVPQEKRDLIDGHTRQQQLDRKGIAEHVGVATLRRAIRVFQSDILEQERQGTYPSLAWPSPGLHCRSRRSNADSSLEATA